MSKFTPTPPSRPKAAPAEGAASLKVGASSKPFVEEAEDLARIEAAPASEVQAALLQIEDWGISGGSLLVSSSVSEGGETKLVAADYPRLLKAAEGGDTDAQYNLGVCYYDGIGVAKDPVEALKLFSLAAGKGDARAMAVLGYYYYNGIGVAKDPAEAVRLFRLAADKGNVEAMVVLGSCCYYNGVGVAKDPAEAVRLFRLAADKGNALAQCCLGLSYFNGEGVEKSTTSAIWHLAKAGSNGLDLLLKSTLRLKFAIAVNKSADNKKLSVDQIIDVIDVLGQSAEIAARRIAQNESTLIADLVEISEIDLNGLRRIKQKLSEVPGMDVTKNASFKSIDDKIGSMGVLNPLAVAREAAPSSALIGGSASTINPLAALQGGARQK